MFKVHGPITEVELHEIVGKLEGNAFASPTRLYQLFSLINHSCIPNVYVSDKNELVTFLFDRPYMHTSEF